MLYTIGTFDSYLQQWFKGESKWKGIEHTDTWEPFECGGRWSKSDDKIKWEGEFQGGNNCNLWIIWEGFRTILLQRGSLVQSCLHMSSDTPSWCGGNIVIKWPRFEKNGPCSPADHVGKKTKSLSSNMSFFCMSGFVPPPCKAPRKCTLEKGWWRWSCFFWFRIFGVGKTRAKHNIMFSPWQISVSLRNSPRNQNLQETRSKMRSAERKHR